MIAVRDGQPRLSTAHHAWPPAHGPRVLDVERWLRPRAAGAAGDRALVLRLLGELPGARLAGAVW